MFNTCEALLAKACYDVASAWNRAEGSPDICNPPWEKGRQEESIRFVRYCLNSQFNPKSLHDGWWQEKLADGWVLGDELDYQAKTDPVLVPFDELSDEIRVRLCVLVSVVRACMDVMDTAMAYVLEQAIPKEGSDESRQSGNASSHTMPPPDFGRSEPQAESGGPLIHKRVEEHHG
ncbi:MAG: hypothetical protein HQM01_08130 [Magnetococcales bacterium]|nr:hypothetical protein [Magnetococcales bacterium]